MIDVVIKESGSVLHKQGTPTTLTESTVRAIESLVGVESWE